MKDRKEQILKAYSNREATKEFLTDKKISDDDFEFILEAGRLSPSSFGWEPWQFLVVQNENLRAKLVDMSWGAQKQLPTASHFVILLGRNPKEMLVGSEYFRHMSQDIYGLPSEIEQMRYDVFEKFQKEDFDLSDDRKIFDWVGKQVYIPFANMMTAAAEIGIDSCPMEGFDKNRVEEVLINEGVLDTNQFGVVAMLAFGYKKLPLEWTKKRRALKDVVTWIR